MLSGPLVSGTRTFYLITYLHMLTQLFSCLLCTFVVEEINQAIVKDWMRTKVLTLMSIFYIDELGLFW